MTLFKPGVNVSCPLPLTDSAIIRMGHGSGGKMTADLIEKVFFPALGNEVLRAADDAALVAVGDRRLAITTDSFVVNPIFFPGGNIGSLAVHGTVNDLAMRGCRPLFMTASFILEEGFAIEQLQMAAQALQEASLSSGIQLVAADTKVVNKGCADKLFISAAGIGLLECDEPPAANRAKPGDRVLVSGDLGLHGMAVMCAREGLDLETQLESDSAPLYELVAKMLSVSKSVHCLRDITRGGLSSAANELALSAAVGMEIEEARVPVNAQVRAACEILGLDPLYVACEGRLLAVVDPADAEAVLAAMRTHHLGMNAQLIGKVVPEHPGRVVLRTQVGGRRILDRLSGEQLPRIC